MDDEWELPFTPEEIMEAADWMTWEHEMSIKTISSAFPDELKYEIPVVKKKWWKRRK